MIDAKVLIISDKHMEIESECRILRHAGCKIETANSLNGLEAHFSIAIIKNSPSIEIFSLLKEVKKMKIPAVAILGYNQEELVLKLLEQGLDNYIMGADKVYLLVPGIVERTLENVRIRMALKDSRQEEVWGEKLLDTAELTAGVVHEIRNPLSIIAMSVEYLVARIDKDDPRRPFADAILRKVEKIEALVKNLVKFGRRQEMKFKPCEANKLVSQVLELITPKCEQLNINPVHELSTENPVVTADADLVEEVLLNLFNNAIDAMPEGGTLTVRTRSDNDNVIIDVCDTGMGVEPEEKDKIFLPFYSKKKGGTGLGLAISKRIISEHNGKIWVENSFPGGAVFRILIPQRQK